jgi:hypothetical protein
MSDQGSRSAACSLRLPRRALGSLADDESHRKRVRDGPAQDGAHERLVIANHAKLMVFKVLNAASKTWRRLKRTNQLPKVIGGVRFQDGIEVIEVPANHAA